MFPAISTSILLELLTACCLIAVVLLADARRSRRSLATPNIIATVTCSRMEGYNMDAVYPSDNMKMPLLVLMGAVSSFENCCIPHSKSSFSLQLIAGFRQFSFQICCIKLLLFLCATTPFVSRWMPSSISESVIG